MLAVLAGGCMEEDIASDAAANYTESGVISSAAEISPGGRVAEIAALWIMSIILHGLRICRITR